MTSAAERFLIDFHAHHTGATRVALGRRAVRCEGRDYASSYEVLAAHVPAGARDILDLACGDGWLLSLLARDHPEARLAGLDMSADELAAAAARLQGRATLREGRAQALPLADGSVDCVTCHMALMLMEDPPRVLAEIHRVLAAGGRLAAVIGISNAASPALDAYRALLRPHVMASPSFVPLGDKRWRTAPEVQALLEGAGFADVRQARIEGEVRLAPGEMWDWLMLMYDAHFLEPRVRADLREQFLAAVAPHVEVDGRVLFVVGWGLLTAARG
jgi:ubiquinone/menaquinone biosynthesis C-methylase UbiE